MGGTLRAQKVAIKQPTKPRCRLHSTEMKFDASTVRWRCMEPNCGIVAYPAQDDQGKPIVGKGDLELVKYTDEDGLDSYFIRACDNNILLNVTDYIEVGSFTSITNVGSPTIISVRLEFKRVVEHDNYRKRQA